MALVEGRHTIADFKSEEHCWAYKNSDHVFPMFYVGNTIIPLTLFARRRKKTSFGFRLDVFIVKTMSL